MLKRCTTAQTAISNFSGRRQLCRKKSTVVLAALLVVLAVVITRSIVR